MGNDLDFTAPDGPSLADVHLNVVWTFAILAIGVAVVAAGGLLL